MDKLSVAREIEAIAETITSGNIMHARSVGGLYGWCERLQTRVRALAALAQPAPDVGPADVALLGAQMVLENKAVNATGALANTAWKPSRSHIEGMRNTMKEALEYIAEARAALTPAPQPAEVKNLPRLTRAMIEAACKAHYGDDNIDGIDLAANDRNYTFEQGFRRMWQGIAAAIRGGAE